MEKDFKIIQDSNVIWMNIITEEKSDGYAMTKAELNKLKAVIDRFLRKDK